MSDLKIQLRDQVLNAVSQGQQLNIIGGDSKSFMGRAANGEPLRVSGHQGIISYQPVELVLTARAGTPLHEIEAALAEHDQMLAFEPPKFGRDFASGVDTQCVSNSTLGGTLATNQSGPARPWCGSVRDHVLGLGLINGRGEKLNFGGQVMKNVAGYDVSRLQAGAMGTLGLITEISLKVMPKPAVTQTLIEPMTVDHAITVMNQYSAQSKPLSGACWYGGSLYLRLSGAGSAVQATVKQWTARSDAELMDPQSAERFWCQLRDQTLPFFGTNSIDAVSTVAADSAALESATAYQRALWRFSVKPTADQPEAINGDWLIDWGGAQRWLRTISAAQRSMAEMETMAVAMAGQVSLYRGGDRSDEVMHRQTSALQAIQQRLKRSLDPSLVFNLGRLYRWM
ncbi:MAG: glycolate oxidase subunit GlcE [Motiliproteus sp.]